MNIIIYRGDKYALTARLLTETRITGGSVTFAINSDRHELLFERTVDALVEGADIAAIDLAGMDTAGIPPGFHFLSIRYWQDGPDAITLAAGVPVEVRRGYPHAPGAVVAGGLGEQGAVLFVMPPDATGANRLVLNIETQGAAIPALTRVEVAEFQAALDEGLVTEAPIDTTPYVREDAGWVPLPVPSHNATGGLNEGDFLHLTAAEYATLQQATNPLGLLTTGDTVTLEIAAYGATTATVPDTATITLAATGWRGVGYWDSHALILTLEGAATVQIPVDWIPQGATLTFASAGTVTLVVYSPDGGTTVLYAGAN